MPLSLVSVLGCVVEVKLLHIFGTNFMTTVQSQYCSSLSSPTVLQLTKAACPLMILLLYTSGADIERSLDIANDSLVSEL